MKFMKNVFLPIALAVILVIAFVVPIVIGLIPEPKFIKAYKERKAADEYNAKYVDNPAIRNAVKIAEAQARIDASIALSKARSEWSAACADMLKTEVNARREAQGVLSRLLWKLLDYKMVTGVEMRDSGTTVTFSNGETFSFQLTEIDP